MNSKFPITSEAGNTLVRRDPQGSPSPSPGPAQIPKNPTLGTLLSAHHPLPSDFPLQVHVSTALKHSVQFRTATTILANSGVFTFIFLCLKAFIYTFHNKIAMN